MIHNPNYNCIGSIIVMLIVLAYGLFVLRFPFFLNQLCHLTYTVYNMWYLHRKLCSSFFFFRSCGSLTCTFSICTLSQGNTEVIVLILLRSVSGRRCSYTSILHTFLTPSRLFSFPVCCLFFKMPFHRVFGASSRVSFRATRTFLTTSCTRIGKAASISVSNSSWR